MINLGETSRTKLEGLHPDLIRVVKKAAAIASPSEDFAVLEGVRGTERMCEVYGQGRTASECLHKGVPSKYAQPLLAKVTWLTDPFNSRHKVQPDGFGHAVDLVPWPVDWKALKRFDTLADLMFAAAKVEGVGIIWGADWYHDGVRREKGESDSPHFQLKG